MRTVEPRQVDDHHDDANDDETMTTREAFR